MPYLIEWIVIANYKRYQISYYAIIIQPKTNKAVWIDKRKRLRKLTQKFEKSGLIHMRIASE